MKVQVLGPNLHADETFHVHAHGCSDTKKAMYRGADGFALCNMNTQRDVVEDAYADIIAEDEAMYGGDNWTQLLSEFKFFPCTSALRSE